MISRTIIITHSGITMNSGIAWMVNDIGIWQTWYVLNKSFGMRIMWMAAWDAEWMVSKRISQKRSWVSIVSEWLIRGTEIYVYVSIFIYIYAAHIWWFPKKGLPLNRPF